MAAQRAGRSDGDEAVEVTGQQSFAGQVAARDANVHHGIRREWLDRLRKLGQHYDELWSAGRLLSGAHRHRSRLSKEGTRVDLEAWYGVRLLFEVEAFLAEEFSSRAEAVALLSDCAVAALDTVESYLVSRELKVHPQWHPEMLNALHETHRRTLAQLRRQPRSTEPLPAYRWRLPARAHLAAWEQMARSCPAAETGRRVPAGCCWDPRQVVAALHDRGLRRVLVLHPFLYGHSCETDVELLGRRRFDWVDLAETHLTADPFDWFIHVNDYDEWDAAGWPLQHEALRGCGAQQWRRTHHTDA